MQNPGKIRQKMVDAGNTSTLGSSVTAQTEKTFVLNVPKKCTKQLSVKATLTSYTAKKKDTKQRTQKN